MSRRSPAFTISLNPVTIPLLFCSNVIGNVMLGANVTSVLGIAVKTLVKGLVERYNCARTVAVPKSATLAKAEKFAATDVIVPVRGTVNAKLASPPAARRPVRSIVFPRTAIPGAELPNPITLVVSTKPRAVAVSIAGIPDAYGMIAPAPAAPGGPGGPGIPCGPGGPGIP